jgi:uncharacterized damage-inducible protein DinB
MNAMAEPSPDQQIKEKQELLALLDASRNRYLAALAEVSEDRCRVRPGEGAWSVLECAEHVSGAERGMFQMVLDRKPTEAEPDRQKDAAILSMAGENAPKAEAPERSRLRGRFASLDEARQAFLSGRERTIAWVEQNDDDLRKFTVAHPLGNFDAYQLLLVMAMHAERHAGQIDRIKRSPAYMAASQK